MRHSFRSIAILLATLSTHGIAMAADDEIRIGLVGGITGYLAPYDQPVLQGAKLAVKQINAQGGVNGKKLTLITRDTRSETNEAVVMSQEVLAEGANILVTPCDGDSSTAGGQVGQAAGVLTIAGCASMPLLPGMVGDLFYLNTMGDNIQATVMANYAIKAGHKTAALLVTPDNLYAQKLPEYFAQVFEKQGGKIVSRLDYKLNQPDFAVEVSKIKELSPQPDVIVTAAFEPDFPAFLQQLRAAGVTIPIVEADGIDTQTVPSLGAVSEGIVYTVNAFAAPGSRLEKFNEDFEKEYGFATDTVCSALGYDLIEIIAAAVKGAGGKLDGASLAASLDQIENLPIRTGTITYKNAHHIPLRSVSIVKLVGGQKQLLGGETPAVDQIPAP